MKRIPKQEYTAEFKEQAVKRADEVGSIARVAEELGLVEQTLRNWVKAAKAGKLNPAGGECQEFCVRDGFDSSCPAAAEQEESAHRAIAGMKRSVYRMANWFIAGFQYSIGFSIQP